MYIPRAYDAQKQYPVLLALHGAGERGEDNVLQLFNLLPDLFALPNTPLAEAIVVVPQCPNSTNKWVDTSWSVPTYKIENVPESNELSAVIELLDQISSEFSTARSRYYVTGISMGGFGTWDLICRHPELFAAAVPICGGVDLSYAESLVNFPIHTVHDAGDPTVPCTGTQKMVTAIKEAGGTVITYDEKDGYGHGVWDWAGKQGDIWTWLFAQKRNED